MEAFTSRIITMTYYDWVRRPLYMRRRIEHKIEDVRLKESACMKSTSEMGERVQTSLDNSTEIRYTRYIDAKNELEDLFDKLAGLQDEVRDFLYNNLNADEADLMEWKYIDGKTAQQIADKYGITHDATRARMSRIEKKLKKVYNSTPQ